jgi:arabinose-5-phosphate isomerase
VSVEIGKRVLRAEARAVDRLAETLGDAFRQAVERVRETRGRVVVTGMGKSGIVARKIAATLASTGTPALFIHPAEAHHGDLGMIAEGDLVIALSNSGETQEVITLLDTIRRLGARLVVMSGRPESTLGREADVLLDTSVQDEGCPLGLAPMASTTATLALGDALAAAVMEAKGFGEEDFARLHPGGRLGKKLARVSQFMHRGEAVPRVASDTPMREVVLEMSRKRLGCTTVVSAEGALLGIVTDGDLRRLLESEREPLNRTAGEVMTAEPRTVTPEVLAASALRIMEERKITMLPVVEAGALLGLVQIHDLWGTQLF